MEEICSVCGRSFEEDALTEFDGRLFCDDCLNEQTVLCYDCDERIYRTQNEGTSEHPLCRRCYDEEYTYCQRCGVLLHHDDAYYYGDDDTPYCLSCYELEYDSSIKMWNEK